MKTHLAVKHCTLISFKGLYGLIVKLIFSEHTEMQNNLFGIIIVYVPAFPNFVYRYISTEYHNEIWMYRGSECF